MITCFFLDVKKVSNYLNWHGMSVVYSYIMQKQGIGYQISVSAYYHYVNKAHDKGSGEITTWAWLPKRVKLLRLSCNKI